MKGPPIVIDATTLTPVFLTVADLQGKPMDRRCVVCLERAYLIYLGYSESENVGCPFGHTRKEACTSFAVPNAQQRAAFQELRRQGLIPEKAPYGVFTDDKPADD